MQTPSLAALAAENKRLQAELAQMHTQLINLSDEVKHHKALAEGKTMLELIPAMSGRADLREGGSHVCQ